MRAPYRVCVARAYLVLTSYVVVVARNTPSNDDNDQDTNEILLRNIVKNLMSHYADVVILF